MNKEILSKVSDMSLLGYYDEDLKLLCVHFFGDGGKKDLMAYLQSDLTWDLREVEKESAQLFEDREVVEITHNPLGKFEANSAFDKMVRGSLAALLKNDGFRDPAVERILANGYGD